MFLKKVEKQMRIDKKTPIIIYGAAGNGMRGYHSLKHVNGYNIIGFIDKRAQEIGMQYNLPVWLPNAEIPVEKNECVVCICIKNVFEHEKIVNELIRQGFIYFIFKPIASLGMKDNLSLQVVDQNYEYIFGDANTKTTYCLEPVPLLRELVLFEFRDRAVLLKTENSVVAIFPFERVFIDSKDWEAGLKDSSNCTNVLALVPQIGLFSFFNGERGHESLELYLNHCALTIGNSEERYGDGGGKLKDTPAWRESIIANRKIVFNKMNESLELNYQFFIHHAPRCELDVQGRLILKSAKHRAAFFIVKKRKFIPLYISINNYNRILNLEAARNLQNYLEYNHINMLRVPVQHPLFYGYPAEMQDFYEQVVYPSIFEIASRILGRCTTEMISVCDALNDEGAIARCMKLMGFQVIAVAEKSETELIHLIDDLMGIPHMKCVPKMISAEIVFCTEEDYHSLDEEIDAKILFLESKDDFLMLPNYIFSKEITHTVWEGKVKYIHMYCHE